MATHARPGPPPRSDREPIAIIGMGCRFPGGVSTPDAYWQLLCAGTDAIRDFPPERWDLRRFYAPDPDTPGTFAVTQAGFLDENIYAFDPQFFGLSPREARTLDPQQRLLLEVSWEALEDAGLPVDGLQGSNTGVFIGGFCLDATLLFLSSLNRELIHPQHSALYSPATLRAALTRHGFQVHSMFVYPGKGKATFRSGEAWTRRMGKLAYATLDAAAAFLLRSRSTYLADGLGVIATRRAG